MRTARVPMRTLLAALLAVLALGAGGTAIAAAQDQPPAASNEPNLEGYFDSLTASPGHLRVQGWALDKTEPNRPAHVDVFIDGTFTLRVVADQDYQGFVGEHGFNAGFTADPGPHQVCIYVVAAVDPPPPPNAPSTDLGCRDATVPQPTSNELIGSFDTLTAGADSFTVTGWGIDQTAQTTPAHVDIYVNGTYHSRVRASVDRPDVGAAYPAAGPDHGFDVRIDHPDGSVRVCIYVVGAIDPPPAPNAPAHDLGCKDATVGPVVPAPFGSFDTADPMPGGVTITGWVINPANDTESYVAVWVDGTNFGHYEADVPRPDVNAAFPSYPGNHGFDLTLDLASGDRTICVYGLNWPENNRNPLLSCKTVTVPAEPAPFGSLDQVTFGSSGGFTVRGWMINPNRETVPGTVAVYADGGFVTNLSSGLSRPDVAAAFPGAGPDHGYEGGSAALSPDQVCVYALSWPLANNNPLLGCANRS